MGKLPPDRIPALVSHLNQLPRKFSGAKMNSAMSQVVAERPLRMLLVEDSTLEAVLVENAVQECNRIQLIHIARDGEEAIAFLHREGQYANAERPDLILLDLHMPKKDGFEVLKEIKKDASLKLIPVIVFTTSEREEDIARSYAGGASTFITKPATFDELQNILNDVGRYWSNAKLPVILGGNQLNNHVLL